MHKLDEIHMEVIGLVAPESIMKVRLTIYERN